MIIEREQASGQSVIVPSSYVRFSPGGDLFCAAHCPVQVAVCLPVCSYHLIKTAGSSFDDAPFAAWFTTSLTPALKAHFRRFGTRHLKKQVERIIREMPFATSRKPAQPPFVFPAVIFPHHAGVRSPATNSRNGDARDGGAQP